VAHTCNPSYSGCRDQENSSSKPAQANSSVRPYLEKPFTKTGLVEWLKVKALSSSPSTEKKSRVLVCEALSSVPSTGEKKKIVRMLMCISVM
jgi:hypothetical protein